MKNSLIGAIAALAFVAGATAAAAHGKILSTNPATNQTAASPSEVRIVLSEAIFPKFSGILLKDHSGHLIKTGAMGVDTTRKQLFVPLKAKLAPGSYQVVWHVVCVDTHRMQGQYGFVVK